MATKKAVGFHPRCQVCVHDARMTIDMAMARGCPVPELMKKFPKLSKSSLYRHFHRHIPGPVLDRLKVKSLGSIVGKSLNVAELTDSENQSLLSQVVALKSSLMGAIGAAERNDAGALFSSLAGRLTKLIEVEARILGQIQTGSVTTINNYLASTEYIALRSAMIEALRPYPQAAVAVARKLLALEAPKQIADVIDVTAINIADGEPAELETRPIDSASPSAPAIEGIEQEGEIVSLHHDQPTCSTPGPVVHLESYRDGATQPREILEGTVRLSR
jgi:hypothetical protein